MELLIFYIKRQEEEWCVLRVKSQTFDLTFFKVNVECVRQSGEHFTGGRAGGLSFFVCKKLCPFLFFLLLFFPLSLVVYFGASSRSFVRHFFFCHHQIGPAESYTSEERVEEWIMEEFWKWNLSIFPRLCIKLGLGTTENLLKFLVNEEIQLKTEWQN